MPSAPSSVSSERKMKPFQYLVLAMYSGKWTGLLLSCVLYFWKTQIINFSNINNGILFYLDFRDLQGQDRANFLKKLKKNHAAVNAINNGIYLLMISSILQCVLAINLQYQDGNNLPLMIITGRDPRIKLTTYWMGNRTSARVNFRTNFEKFH